MGYYLFAILPNINIGIGVILSVLSFLVMLLSVALIVEIPDREIEIGRASCRERV